MGLRMGRRDCEESKSRPPRKGREKWGARGEFVIKPPHPLLTAEVPGVRKYTVGT
jgi:hypothetical protein